MRSAMLAITAAAVFVPSQLRADPLKAAPVDVGAGRVAWFDITTSDLSESRAFYSKLFGWVFTPLQGTDQALEIVAGGVAIGTLRVAEGKISSFNGVVYVQVADAQATCQRAKELGATVPPGFPFNLQDRIGAVGLFVDPGGHPVGIYSIKASAMRGSSRWSWPSFGGVDLALRREARGEQGDCSER